MKLVVLDKVGCHAGDAGRPAQFSQPTIAWLEKRGHEVTILDGFDKSACAAADAVWTEWCNEDAFAAALSGVCKRLIVRLRGYELWSFPLQSFPGWPAVHTLVYESTYLAHLARDLHLPVATAVIPAGIDLARFSFEPHEGRTNVVAMIGRADGIKGWDLALEWAYRRSDLDFRFVMSGGESRIIESVRLMAPRNVEVNVGRVDTAAWLWGVQASYLLSPSAWESLGYTIIEAMAMGIRPLVRRRPGVEWLWSFPCWRTIADIDSLMNPRDPRFEPRLLRTIVEENFNAEKNSARFEALLK